MKEKKTEFANVDEYIAHQPEAVREGLELLRKTVKEIVPDAEEVISYQIPAYKFHGMLAYFAAFSNHYGFYPTPAVIEKFKDKLKSYKQGKGSIQIPFEQSIPVKLIKEMLEYKMKENLEKKNLKDSLKRKK